MTRTKIEWAGYSWNPVTGCEKYSPGCKNCYAFRIAQRLQGQGQPKYVDGFRVTLHDRLLKEPLRMKKSRSIFVNSMSDLFHRDVPVDFIRKVIDVMHRAFWHRYLVLTKRSERLRDLDSLLDWPFNCRVGVSVENRDYLYRIEDLKKTGVPVKVVCFEPLLGPIPPIDLSGIDWVIAGGESGPCARPMREEWALELRDQCLKQKVPFYFKQWGGPNRNATGRILAGRMWEQRPQDPPEFQEMLKNYRMLDPGRGSSIVPPRSRRKECRGQMTLNFS